MELFSLVAKLVCDNTQFNSDIASAETTMENLGKKTDGVVAGMKQAFLETDWTSGLLKLGVWVEKSFNKTLDYADAVDKGSKKIGISAKAYQELDYALGMSGASVDDLKIGISALNKELETVQNGEGSDIFDALGVSAFDAEGEARELGDVLEDVLLTLANMENKTARSNIVESIFGKNKGKELAAFLDEGERGIQKLLAEAEDLGLVMSDESIQQSVQTKDSMDKLSKTIDDLVYTIMEPFVPVVGTIADIMTPAVSTIASIIGSVVSAIQSLIGFFSSHDPSSSDMYPTAEVNGHEIMFLNDSGQWDVPHDDYPTILHDGEMVLNASRARDYRSGEGGGNNAALLGMIQRLENTLANLRLTVNGRDFGRATVDYSGSRMNNYIGGAENRLAAGYGS